MFKPRLELIQGEIYWTEFLKFYEKALSSVTDEKDKELVRGHYVDKILNDIKLIKNIHDEK